MPDKIQQIYELYKSSGLLGSVDLPSFSSADKDQQKQIYDLGVQNGIMGGADFESFSSAFSPTASAAPETSAQAEPLKKKDDTTVSSSGGFSLAQSDLPKDNPPIPAFTGFDATTKQSLKQSATEQQYAGQTVPQGPITIKDAAGALPQSKEDFDASVNSITGDLLGNSEEFVAPKLNYMLGNYNFHVSEAKPGTDAVEITAPNGTTKTVSIPAFTSDKVLHDRAAAEIRDFVTANKPKTLAVADEYKYYERKFATQKEATDAMTRINDEAHSLADQQKAIARDEITLQKARQAGDPNADALEADLAERKKAAMKQELSLPIKERKLKASLGRYEMSKAEQGTLAGAVTNAMIGSTYDVFRAVDNLKSVILTSIIPTRMLVGDELYNKAMEDMAKSKGVSVSELSDDDRSSVKRDLMRTFRGVMKSVSGLPSTEKVVAAIGTSTTPEYTAAQSSDPIKRNIIGAAGFLPMMLAPEIMPATFGLSAYQGAMDKMDKSEEFKDMSESERAVPAVMLGMVNAVLSETGLRSLIGNTSLAKSIAALVIEKAGSKASASTIRELIENEVEDRVSRGLLTTAAEAAKGGVMGAEMKAGDITVKELYNKMKGKELFDTPDSLKQAVEEVGHSALDMAIGGAMISIPHAIGAAKADNNFNGITAENIQFFDEISKSDQARSAFTISLKNDIVSGKLTPARAQEIKDGADNVAGLMKSIPDDFAPEQKRKALGLLIERQGLEAQVAGKAKALVKKQTDRISEIDAQLEKLSDNAIQEQSTTEVPVGEQSQGSQGVSGENTQGQEAAKQGEAQDEVTHLESLLGEGPDFKAEESLAQKTIDNAEYTPRKKDGIIVRLPIDSVISATDPSWKVERGNENEMPGRIDKAKWHLESSPKELEASSIYINPESGTVGFEDGRHRLIAAKELGATHAYFEINNTPEQIEAVKKINDGHSPTLKNDIKSTESDIVLYKGVGGKKNIDGSPRSAHPEAKGIFSSLEKNEAERFGESEPIEFSIPKGTTIQTVRADNWNEGVSLVRKEETRLINESPAQIVELKTRDARGKEESQFIIKDKSLLGDHVDNTLNAKPQFREGEVAGSGAPVERTQELMGRMNEAFPSVKASASKEEFDKVMASDGVRQFVKDGQIVYGVTSNGDVYINPEVHNSESALFNTAIHEFGHVWTDFLHTSEKGRAIHAKGVSLIEDAVRSKDAGVEPIYREQLKKFGGDRAKATRETMAILIGNKGEAIANQSLKSKFVKWLDAMWQHVKQSFKMSKDLTSFDIENMTLDHFTGTALADLLGREKLTGEKVASVDAKAEHTPERIAEIARANGISEGAIKTVLEKRGFTPEQISKAMASKESAKSVEISEETLPGYDRMMSEAADVMIRSINNKRSPEDIESNVVEYLKGSKAYEQASDTQREELVRQAREMIGMKEKSSPSVEKVLGTINDAKMITVDEKEMLNKQIKDYARGAKDAKVAWSRAGKDLVSSLRDMVVKGKITTDQMMAVMNKFANVNMFDGSSIDRFTDYMGKVFADVEYANRMKRIAKDATVAKKNIKSKIGADQELYASLRSLFSIKPSAVPESVIDMYEELASMFGERAKELSIDNRDDVKNAMGKIFDAIAEEQSSASDLKDVFDNYSDKQLNDKGGIDYSKTIDKMIEDQAISASEADLMRKYKDIISPKEAKEEKTPEEKAQEEADAKVSALDAIDAMKSSGIEIDPSNLSSRVGRDTANAIKDLMDDQGVLDQMSSSDLNDLIKVVFNINNGFLSNTAQILKEKMNSIKLERPVEEHLVKLKPLVFEKYYAKLKGLVTGRRLEEEMIRRNPITGIDQLFGSFKDTHLYDAVFRLPAEAQAAFMSSYLAVQNKLDEALARLSRSHGNDPDKITQSKYNVTAYRLQREYEQNKQSKGVAPAKDWIDATIKHIDSGRSLYTSGDKKMLEKIVTGTADEMWDNLTNAEKKMSQALDEISQNDLFEKALHAKSVLRNGTPEMVSSHVHHYVLGDRTDLSNGGALERSMKYMRGSTRAGSLENRTAGVKPIEFDAYASMNKHAREVLMDYHMTEAIRTTRRVLDRMLKSAEGHSENVVGLVAAIKNAYDQAEENVIAANAMRSSTGDKVIDYLTKQGYRVMLAGSGRAASELISNASFLAYMPKEVTTALENKEWVYGDDLVKIMNNVHSSNTHRVAPHDNISSSKLIDSSILSDVSGVKGSRAHSAVMNKLLKIHNNTTKKYVNSVEALADMLITTPDKISVKTAWGGAFAREFEAQTGEKVDAKKLADNDEVYMREHKDAIEKAKNVADKASVFVGASDNPFMGILKGSDKHKQQSYTRLYHIYNNFMSKFNLFEFTTARTAVHAAMGKGYLTQKQGVALLGAVATRMTLYTILSKYIGAGIVGAAYSAMGGGDDKQDKNTVLEEVSQALASTATSLFLNKTLGNAMRNVVNYGVEKFNENYLDFMREGEYDPYQDNISYTTIPVDNNSGKTDIAKNAAKYFGPLSPIIGTAVLAGERLTEPEKKTQEAIDRANKDLMVRVPLEIAGNVGLIPLYKDVRKVMMKEMYKDMDQSSSGKSSQGGLTKEEMKKYLPDVYKQMQEGRTELKEFDKMKSKMQAEKKRLREQMLRETFK
jgi:hypothetical protein